MRDWIGNQNSIYKTLGASNHTDKDRAENDYYATDPIAIDKLLTVETPSHCIWECAYGIKSLKDEDLKLETEIIKDYNDIKKANEDVSCKIKE